MKNKKLKKFIYYFLSLTWGSLMTTVGCFVAVALLITGHKPKKHAGCFYFEVGESWGGFELGLFFVCSRTSGKSTKDHEFGHNIQNCILGPLMPFIVSIPSAIRYWYREFKYYKKGLEPITVYDAIWFEGQASKWGKIFAANW